MSRQVLPSGDDHPEAAGRHLTDASVLRQEDRCDGAAYLAGYVIECTLKTIIVFRAGIAADPRGHVLDGLSLTAARLASLPGARTVRYRPGMTPGHSIYDTAHGWRPGLRYRESGSILADQARDWLDEATVVYRSAIVPMWLDGVL